MQEELVVLLTATLDPGAFAKDTKRPSVESRLRDYADALRFWDDLDDRRIAGIVVCENSGAKEAQNLAEIAREAGKPVEVLSFEGNAAPPGVHYGYAELGIVDHAYAQSRLLRSRRLFLKATGRLRFPNVSKLLDALPEALDCALDLRRAYPGEGGIGYRARTQLMLFARDFYGRRLFETREGMIGRCSHIEEWLPTLLTPLHAAGQSALSLRFPIECEIAGVQGSDNLDYADFQRRWKRTLRSVLRRAAPGLWL